MKCYIFSRKTHFTYVLFILLITKKYAKIQQTIFKCVVPKLDHQNFQPNWLTFLPAMTVTIMCTLLNMLYRPNLVI